MSLATELPSTRDGVGISGAGGDDIDWCMPVTVLDVAEQTVTDIFELHPLGKTRVRLRWVEGGRECELAKRTALRARTAGAGRRTAARRRA